MLWIIECKFKVLSYTSCIVYPTCTQNEMENLYPSVWKRWKMWMPCNDVIFCVYACYVKQFQFNSVAFMFCTTNKRHTNTQKTVFQKPDEKSAVSMPLKFCCKVNVAPDCLPNCICRIVDKKWCISFMARYIFVCISPNTCRLEAINDNGLYIFESSDCICVKIYFKACVCVLFNF